MPTQFSAPLDQQTLVPFLRHVLTAAKDLPRDMLQRYEAAPAGIPIEMWFDDSAEATLMAPRVVTIASVDGELARISLYMLSMRSFDWDVLPDVAADADLNALRATVAAAGLRVAFPKDARAWQIFDPMAGIGVQLARSPTDLPAWFVGAPFRHHIHWLLRERNWRMAHAATLGQDGRGLILFGNGGAGKSGTTLAGLAAGLKTVGDDYIAVGENAPAIARPLFRVAKQDRAGLGRIAGLGERLAHLPPNWMNKIEFDPDAIFPGCLVDALAIKSVVLPRIANAPVPRFSPASPGEVMRVLIPTNLSQFAGEPVDGLGYYGGLVRGAPAYWLDLSASAADNGAALAEFVATLG